MANLFNNDPMIPDTVMSSTFIRMGWTAHEEETIGRIMANENVPRVTAIQAMRRREQAGKSLSRRLKLQDPFNSSAFCQRGCPECTLISGEINPEMAAFLDIMVNHKQRSGEYFLVQRDPITGFFPVSARDGDLTGADELGLVPREPYEPALELTRDGIIEGRIYVRHAMSRTLAENAVLASTEAIRGENVDGLMPLLAGVTPEPTPLAAPIKTLRGRPRVTGEQKRLAAADRQARWRRKQAAKQSLETGPESTTARRIALAHKSSPGIAIRSCLRPLMDRRLRALSLD